MSHVDADGTMHITLPERLRRERAGTVSERHERRLTELEATVERLLSNEAKLIADSVTAQAALATLADVTQALMGEDLALRSDAEESRMDLTRADITVSTALIRFRGMSFGQRLRWLITGVVE